MTGTPNRLRRKGYHRARMAGNTDHQDHRCRWRELRIYNLPVGSYLSIRRRVHPGGAEDRQDSAHQAGQDRRYYGRYAEGYRALPKPVTVGTTLTVVSESTAWFRSAKIKQGNRGDGGSQDGQKRKYLIGDSKHPCGKATIVRAGTPLSDRRHQPPRISSTSKGTSPYRLIW